MPDNYAYPLGADADPEAPWNEKDHKERTKDCPDCDGNGHFDDSECCGDKLFLGICMGCKEHAEPSICEYCKGNGEIEDDN